MTVLIPSGSANTAVLLKLPFPWSRVLLTQGTAPAAITSRVVAKLHEFPGVISFPNAGGYLLLRLRDVRSARC